MSGEAVEAHQRALQHDLNCLSDPNRAVRTRALQKLRTYLTPLMEDVKTQAEVRQLFVSNLHEPLTKAFADQIEKNRELALSLYSDLAKLTGTPTQALLPELAKAVQSRFANEPTEPAEELRLELIRLLADVVELTTERRMVMDSLDALVSASTKSLADHFPDLKREAARLVSVLAIKLNTGAAADEKAEYTKTLLKALTPNLKHQHSKVRQTTVEAIGALVLLARLNGPLADEIIPQVSLLTADRASAVKQTLVADVAKWLQTVPPSDASAFARLLLIIIGAIADENESVKADALAALDKVASAEAKVADGQAKSHESKTSSWPPADIAAPLTESPAPSVSWLVNRYLRELLNFTLKSTAEWTTDARLRAARVLHLLVLFSGSDLASHTANVLPAVYKALQDEDADVKAAIIRCTRALGAMLDSTVYWPLVALSLAEPNDSKTVAIALQTLTGACSGTQSSESLVPQLPQILLTLSDTNLSASSDAGVRLRVVELMTILLHKCGAACASSDAVTTPQSAPPILHTLRGRAFWCLHELDAASYAAVTEDVAADLNKNIIAASEDAMKQLASAAHTTNIYDDYFDVAMGFILKSNQGAANTVLWNRESLERHLFVRYVERTGAANMKHLDVVMPAVVAAGHVDRDYAVRMDALHIVTLLSQFPSTAWSDVAKQLIIDVLVPNCAWRVGKAAAVLRLQSLTCLEYILRNAAGGAQLIDSVRDAVLPIVRSTLDDDDVEMRLTSTKACTTVLSATEKKFDDILVSDLSRDLLKRFDDSSDAVRLEVCKTYAAFVQRCLPPHNVFDPTNSTYQYIMQTLLVHLDDSSPQIQNAVLELLKVLSRYNREEFVKHVRTARDKHSSPANCDKLLAYAEGSS